MVPPICRNLDTTPCKAGSSYRQKGPFPGGRGQWVMGVKVMAELWGFKHGHFILIFLLNLWYAARAEQAHAPTDLLIDCG